MFVGTRQIYAGQIKLGDFVAFSAFMAFLIAPVAQIVSIGTRTAQSDGTSARIDSERSA